MSRIASGSCCGKTDSGSAGCRNAFFGLDPRLDSPTHGVDPSTGQFAVLGHRQGLLLEHRLQYDSLDGVRSLLLFAFGRQTCHYSTLINDSPPFKVDRSPSDGKYQWRIGRGSKDY